MRLYSRLLATLIALSLLVIGIVAVQGHGRTEQGPIDVALGLASESVQKEMRRAAADRSRSFHSILRKCLVEAGFDSVPREPDAVSVGEVPIALSAQDVQLRMGYGITTSASRSGPPEDYSLSLMQFAEALDDENRVRFSGVLNGAEGCRTQASQLAFGRLLTASEAFDDQRSAMLEELARDPRIAEVGSKWSSCMGGAFKAPPDVAVYLSQQLANLPSGSTERLAELQAEELALAKRDLACRAKVVDPVYTRLLHAAERKFVLENAALMEQLRGALLEGVRVE